MVKYPYNFPVTYNKVVSKYNSKTYCETKTKKMTMNRGQGSKIYLFM